MRGTGYWLEQLSARSPSWLKWRYALHSPGGKARLIGTDTKGRVAWAFVCGNGRLHPDLLLVDDVWLSAFLTDLDDERLILADPADAVLHVRWAASLVRVLERLPAPEVRGTKVRISTSRLGRPGSTRP